MLTQDAIDRERLKTAPAGRHVIEGKLADNENGETIDSISPIDGSVLSPLANGGEREIGLAVASARRAFEDGRWSRQPPKARKKTMIRIAELLESLALEFAVLGARENGTEIGVAYYAEPLGAAETFRYYAEAIDKRYGEIAPTGDERLGLIHRDPIGVIGAIVPWNFPLMLAAWKAAPALAAGNSVVIKPSETASLLVMRLAEIALEAGLPEGVLNVVMGRGETAGAALALNGDVDVLTFTGSGAVGRRLLEYAARSNLKRVYLELGGKSPNIVFADADLDAAAEGAARAIFVNSGQVCIAGSRLLVEGSIEDAFLEKLAAQSARLKVGDPLDLGNTVGAVHSAAQLDKNLAFAKEAAETARLVAGGSRMLEETGGYYMAPTIFAGVTPDMRLAKEEVFGPVLGVTAFDGADEAIRIANDTPYGLAAGVWTSNLKNAHQMIRRIRAGAVHINCYGGVDNTMPIGGMKQSGNGYDKSLHALDKYVNLKSAWIAL